MNKLQTAIDNQKKWNVNYKNINVKTNLDYFNMQFDATDRQVAEIEDEITPESTAFTLELLTEAAITGKKLPVPVYDLQDENIDLSGFTFQPVKVTKMKFEKVIADICRKDDIRPAMMGVFHDNGFKVATDANVLTVIKQTYAPELEGKIINPKTGFEITNLEYPFPPYKKSNPGNLQLQS